MQFRAQCVNHFSWSMRGIFLSVKEFEMHIQYTFKHRRALENREKVEWAPQITHTFDSATIIMSDSDDNHVRAIMTIFCLFRPTAKIWMNARSNPDKGQNLISTIFSFRMGSIFKKIPDFWNQAHPNFSWCGPSWFLILWPTLFSILWPTLYTRYVI